MFLLYVFLSMFVDVVFPLRLSALTYKIPDGMPSDIVGKIVKAPLMRGNCFGLAVETRMESGSYPARIREITGIHDSFASETHLKFLTWLSEYYLSPVGLALKSSFFDEAVMEPPKRRRSIKEKAYAIACPLPETTVASSIVSRVIEGVNARAYSSLVYHATEIDSEYSVISEVLRNLIHQLRGIMILVPEAGFIKKAAPFLTDLFGERLTILHSKLSKYDRAEAIRKIISGESDVILGTRSAMLAPLPRSSFIAVIEEQSQSYKGEEGLRYNARDLAVMRAYMDKSCVLLSSICPSLETVFNVHKGKYVQINRIGLQSSERRPRVRIVTFKTKKQSELSLSSEVISEAGGLLQRKEKVLFLAGRKGYSLIRCEDCGHIEACGSCTIPKIFYKGSGMLKCHHCGHEHRCPEVCEECGGMHLKPFSSGTERVMQDVQEVLKTPALLVEKVRVSSPPANEFSADNPGLSDFAPFVVGTSLAKRTSVPGDKFSAAVLMNVDLLLAQPDFRAYEHTFQEIIEASQLVKRDGLLMIQTKSPGSKVLKCIKHYDFETFQDLELSQRRELDYPPYSRMVLFSAFTNDDTIHADLWKAVRIIRDDAVTVLGPIEATSSSKSFGQCHHILLKSKDNKRLHEMAKILLAKLEENKKIKVAVDVDPIKI